MNTKNGGLYILGAAILFSLGGVCSKFNGWSGITLNGARCFLALIPLGIYILCKKHKLVFNLRNILGGVCLFLTTTLCMMANKMTTAANAIILQYAAPIYIILYRRIFKKIRSGFIDIITCALVFAGLVFFVIDSLSAGGMAGNIIAVLSGISYAGFCIMGEEHRTDNMSMIFIGFAISAAIGLPFTALETDFSFVTVATACILGFFQIGLAYILFGIGLERTGAVTTSLISTIEPILNPILVALIYKEKMGTTAVIGAITVIAAILAYNIITGRKKDRASQ